jgi:hypothetical protein
MDLTAILLKILERCGEDGLVSPLIVCFISPNGSITGARMNPGEAPEFLADHSESDSAAGVTCRR